MVVPRRLRLIWNFFAQAGPRRLALPVSSMSSTWNLNETTPATPAGTHILERELQGPVLHLEAGGASTLSHRLRRIAWAGPSREGRPYNWPGSPARNCQELCSQSSNDQVFSSSRLCSMSLPYAPFHALSASSLCPNR